MNLTYFKSYLEVVRRGSFSDAAKALGLSQPTVSFQIQRLEGELTTKLLDRQGGRIIVTAAGQEFRAFAERVLQEEHALQERLAFLHDEVAGTLSLGASTNPGEQIVPALLGDFRRLYPKVTSRISIGDTAEIVEKVLARESDAGFIGAEVKRRGLAIKQVAVDPLLLVAAPDHPLVAERSIKLEILEEFDFVVRGEGSGTQKRVEDLMQEAGLSPAKLKRVLVVGSNQAVMTAVEAGVGLAFASQKAASRSLELNRVCAIPIEGVEWVRGIYFIHLSNPVMTRLFQEFSRFVDTWFET
jgi:DNA-binding transcriptional LysR family regulator